MFGFSIYPYKEDPEATARYIKMAADYRFGRVFTNMLMIEPGKEQETVTKLKKAIGLARFYQMEVILDINPSVLKQLHVDYRHLAFFKELGATGVRLDTAFDGFVESLMTFDKADLTIEMNMSNDTQYIENVISYQPNKAKIIACHNFYPQRYTGLDYDFFIKCTKKYKNLGLRTAAFVNSQSATHGPHAYSDGLCTLEMHRDLDITVQARHLVATGLIDDIIIANAFASEEEMSKLASVNTAQLQFDVIFNRGVTSMEKEVVLSHQHVNRGDINRYSIRSTFVRTKYKHKSIPKNNVIHSLKKGDVTIGNDTFGQYKGELTIVRRAMPNDDEHKNVVAHIRDDESFLIQYLKPWDKFCFVEQK
jgi:hypothetical protein